MDAGRFSHLPLYSGIHSVTGLQQPPVANFVGQTPGAQFQQEIVGVIKKGQPFTETAKNVMALIEARCPAALKELRGILVANPTMAEELKGKGWNAIKQEHGHGNRIVEFELLRKNIVEGTWNVVVGALAEMGHANPGGPIAFGTPGWNSDIDTVFVPSENLPESAAVLAKLIFDMVVLNEVGKLPGFAMDTESYLNHAGSALGSEEKLKSADAKAGFARNELNGSNLQMARQLGGVTSKEWESFKKAEKEAAGNSDLADALEQSFADVEAFEREVSEAVDLRVQAGALQHTADADPAVARMSYKATGLVRLSEAMDAVKGRIAALETNCARVSSANGGTVLANVNNSSVAAMAQSSAKKVADKNDHEIEKARLQLGTMYLVRTSFFDEGYNTEGCFISICSKNKGQIHERGTEKAKDEMRRRELDLSGTSSPLSSPVVARKVKGAIQQMGKAADSLGMPVLGGRIRSASLSLMPDYSPSVMPTVSPRTQERGAKTKTYQEMLGQASENNAMYRGHFSCKAQKIGAQASFVANSKYSKRTIGGALELLEAAAKDCAGTEGYKVLLQQLKSCHDVVVHLETAKRGQRLPGPVAEKMLLDAIGKAKGVPVEELGDSVRNAVKTLVEVTEKRIAVAKFEGEIILENLLPTTFAYLIDVFTLDPRSHRTGNKEVDTVVFALLGLNKKEYNTAPVFQDVGTRTLECLGFTVGNPDVRIEQFNSQFDMLVREAIYFVHANSKILEKPSSDKGAFSLQFHWQNANSEL